MKILVIGGGGREHAIIKKLKENKNVENIYALPGNGGIAADAQCVDIGAKDIDGIVKFAVENSIDFAVVAPDDPLVLGAVDALDKAGIACFGPDAKAAIIEGSKAFSKQLMKKYGIPTARFEVFDSYKEAVEFINGFENENTPLVVKADGLALGKGVLICENRSQAVDALNVIMNDKIFGASGNKVVIEEFLTGPEVSVLTFCDGKTVVPMVSGMDHKRAKDGDTGLNTGGMGTVAPNPYYTAEIAERCMNEIFLPSVKAMQSEGREFKGCLYFGLMLTQNGPKVIEYNCRFGDPETQVVLPLLKTDLLAAMQACENGTLDKIKIEFENKCACCVIAASQGYPEHYEKGFEINIDKDIDAEVYVAGAVKKGGALVTSGGRVLGVTAVGDSLEDAVDKVYREIKKVNFKNIYYRRDIGAKALNK